MHEGPVTQDILRIVLEYAKQHEAAKVKKVVVKIGELTGYVEDSIRFYWETLTPGTAAEGAELIIEYVPIVVRCQSCGHEYHAPDQYALFCPECNFFGGQLLSGKEMIVEKIEVE